MSFRKKAKEHKRVIILRKMMRNGHYNLATADLIKEIQKLHSERIVIKLTTAKLMKNFQIRFTDAALENQAFRSRIVQIKMDCWAKSSDLEKHIKALRIQLKTDLKGELQDFKTIDAKNAAIDVVLGGAIQLLSNLKTVIDIADQAIADIDQASWLLKNVLAAVSNIGEKNGASF